MKFTVIIVLASLMVSCVSFVSALARPKLGASRIQMTTKMSNGMAANIKTMVGLVVTGLVAKSSPAWAAEPPAMSHKFKYVVTPNFVRLEIPDPNATLEFTCVTGGTSTAILKTVSFNTDERVAGDVDVDVGPITCNTNGVDVKFIDPTPKPSGSPAAVPQQLIPTTKAGTFSIMYQKGGIWNIK